MDIRLNYQSIIKKVLQEHTDYPKFPDGYESEVLFDDDRRQYRVLDIGWNSDRYLHASLW